MPVWLLVHPFRRFPLPTPPKTHPEAFSNAAACGSWVAPPHHTHTNGWSGFSLSAHRPRSTSWSTSPGYSFLKSGLCLWFYGLTTWPRARWAAGPWATFGKEHRKKGGKEHGQILLIKGLICLRLSLLPNLNLSHELLCEMARLPLQRETKMLRSPITVTDFF